MKLRPYQEDVLKEVGGSGIHTDLIIDAPTGSGKSIIIAKICSRLEHTDIVIVTNVSKLIYQLSETLTAVGIDHSVLKAGMDERFDSRKRVQLVSEQTYHSRKPKLACDILIKDEYHIAFDGDRFNQMKDELKPRKVIGTSATAYDEFGIAIPDHQFVKTASIKELTILGYLSPMRTYIPRKIQEIDFSSMGGSGDYTESELEEVTNTKQYNHAVVVAWMKLPRQIPGFMKTIGFVGGIQHAEDLAATFREHGVEARAVHSKQDPKVRGDIMANFDGKEYSLVPEPDIQVLIGVSSLHTGYDAPDIECVINCRPTKRRSLFVQMTGRGLRIHPSLAYAIHLDCAQATATHGLYDDAFVPYDSKDSLPYETTKREKQKALIDYITSRAGSDVYPIGQGLISEMSISLASDVSIEALKAKFDSSQDAREMLDLGCELYSRVYGVETEEKTKQWIMLELKIGVEQFGLRSFRTRLRNIIKKKQKIASLYYFRSWLIENVSRY